MSFIHEYLLYGLALAGVPVLLHLIARQKPKVLRFPAFRFLRQRHLSNRRKLRLQHLLLLALRMFLIAGLCLALARPQLAGGPMALTGERPVAAALLFDTSPSMDYSSGGSTCLDAARQRARELLQDLPAQSQVAVLDAGEDNEVGPEWVASASALSRLESLRTHPAAATLNRGIDRGLHLLEQLSTSDDAPARFIYIFSDRMRACWDKSGIKPKLPEGVRAIFVDQGADQPRDLAIDKVDVDPPVVPAGGPMKVWVTVRATGDAFDTMVNCQVGNDSDKRPVKLAAGQSQVVLFERTAPERPAGSPVDALFQVTAQVATTDALPFNNVRHATFAVRERRKVLTLVGPTRPRDEPWRGWEIALNVVGAFQCEVRPAPDAAKLTLKALQPYPVIVVFQADPGAAGWKVLAEYVRGGGGLVVIPGGDDWLAPQVRQFNTDAAELLPAPFEKVVKTAADAKAVRWAGFPSQHPVTVYFGKTIRTAAPDYGTPGLWPAAYAWWALGPLAKDASIVTTFADDKKSVALAERTLGTGHVLQLTTPMDFRNLDARRRWVTYGESSFFVVLADQLCRYLAGDSALPELNFRCGQPVILTMPQSAAAPPYVLNGPGLSVAEGNLKSPDAEGRLPVPQAVAPGNYAVLDGKGRLAGGFSLDIRAEESDLEKMPIEEIEGVLGSGSVLTVGRDSGIKEALAAASPPPMELLPGLMIAVLFALALESFLANRFYRPAATDAEQAQPAPAGGPSQ